MKKFRRTSLINLTLSAMLMALALVLPFLTGQLQQLGSMLLPMHLPIMVCGLVCGWKYGLAVGLVTPILRSLLFSMPVLYPNAVSMAIELATYGAVIGLVSDALLHLKSFKSHPLAVAYASLVPAMLAGRVTWGMTQALLLGIKGASFTFKAFLSGAFLSAFPGIIIQLVIVPLIYTAVVRLAWKSKS
ncbi:MAG: ECF transporter S component [Clostridia bacterium]|nr:ECF transporter S component [Clostridia bacterium]